MFMLEKLREAGCPVNAARHVVCRPCDSSTMGGAFDPDTQRVVLCENNFFSDKVNRTIRKQQKKEEEREKTK